MLLRDCYYCKDRKFGRIIRELRAVQPVERVSTRVLSHEQERNVKLLYTVDFVSLSSKPQTAVGIRRLFVYLCQKWSRANLRGVNLSMRGFDPLELRIFSPS